MSYRRTKNSRCIFFPGLLLILLFSFSSPAQNMFITGKVINGSDQSPLPFVILKFDGGNIGTTSNMDGKFNVPDSVRQVRFSYVGFKPLTLPVKKSGENEWLVNLIPDDLLLSTIEESPQDDPAFKIMQSVMEYAAYNDPTKLESFQYTSYNKFRLSADDPSKSELTGKMRITARELEKLQERFEENHMLLMETISKKKFLLPNHENEEIVSTRVIGLKKEAFFLLANQLQGFSIYKENFSLLSKTYLSPVGKSALRNYAFILEDTLRMDLQDTVFLIRFHPAKGRNFDGLKGFLHINTNGYAVQSVVAEPAYSGKNEISASIWQHYNRLETGHWFPSELNAAITFKMMTSIPRDPKSSKRIPIELSVTANSRTNLSQRTANIPLDLKSFGKFGLTVSNERRDSFLNSSGFRYIPLTTKDSSTYVYLDSLGRKVKMFQKAKLLHALSLGTIPVGVFNINFMYLLGFNINEGYKFGLGLNTNRKLSKYFATGIYFTYGTGDGEFRHGEWLRIYPTGYPNFIIQLGYRNFKKEYGEEEMLTDYNIFEPEYFRSLLITNMFLTKNYSASVEIRPIQPLNMKVFMDHGNISRNSYGNFSPVVWDAFRLTRTGIELRYSPGIAFLNDPEELIQSSAPKSEFYFSAIQGMKLFQSQYQYTKIDTKAKFNIRLSATGNTAIMIRGGKIFGNAPITEWFHGYGSYSGAFTLLPHNAFGTMRLNEFSANQYAILHIRHNFGRGFIPTHYFVRPELVLTHNIGFGFLEKKYTTYSGATDFSKGFYESGIELNKILNTGMAGFGFGTYYRYGPYRLSTNKQNFAYKFTINFKL